MVQCVSLFLSSTYIHACNLACLLIYILYILKTNIFVCLIVCGIRKKIWNRENIKKPKYKQTKQSNILLIATHSLRPTPTNVPHTHTLTFLQPQNKVKANKNLKIYGYFEFVSIKKKKIFFLLLNDLNIQWTKIEFSMEKSEFFHGMLRLETVTNLLWQLSLYKQNLMNNKKMKKKIW